MIKKSKIVTLVEITMDNFSDCIKLRVAESQVGFVALNMYSLAEAKADDVSNPYAIYADDAMVGFIMYWYDNNAARGYIDRLMIDKRYQGNGYGKQAMVKVIEILKKEEDITDIQTSYHHKNTVAGNLYKSFGFIPNGEMIEDRDVVVILPITDVKQYDISEQKSTKNSLDNLILSISEIDEVDSIGISGKLSPLPKPSEGDIDIFVYYRNVPIMDIRREMMSKCQNVDNIKYSNGNIGVWGVIDFCLIDGIDVCIMYFEIDDVLRNIDEILAGKYLWKINNDYYPIGRISMLSKINILYDKNDFLKGIRDSLQIYPSDLKDKMTKFHSVKMFNREDFQRAISQEDVLFYHWTLDMALEHFLFVLFTLNETYFPSRKRSFEYINDFKVKPENCKQRLELIIKHGASTNTIVNSYSLYSELCKELSELL